MFSIFFAQEIVDNYMWTQGESLQWGVHVSLFSRLATRSAWHPLCQSRWTKQAAAEVLKKKYTIDLYLNYAPHILSSECNATTIK